MRAVAVASLILVLFAGCVDSDDKVRLVIDFNDYNRQIHDVNLVLDVDRTIFESVDAYEGKNPGHAGYFTVHDLILAWNSAHGFDLDYTQGSGYWVEGIFGVIEDKEGACLDWVLTVNGREFNSISKAPVNANDIVMFKLVNCWEQPSQAVLEFDFNGRAAGDISTPFAFDAATRPSAGEYSGKNVEHPAYFNVHDLMKTWAGYDDVEVTFWSGLGYTLDSVLGVSSNFDDGECWFWQLVINGEETPYGMTDAPVNKDDVITWVYTDCS